MGPLNLISAAFSVAEVSLSLLKEREKNYLHKQSIEFAKRLHAIRTEWYKEYNRDPKTRSDAVLDALELELCQYLTDFAAIIRSSDLPDK